MSVSEHEFLTTHSVFQFLTEPELAKLETVSDIRTYRKGNSLFVEDALADRVWVVKSGRVHISHVSFQGHCQTSCVLTRGDIFCCIPTMDSGKYTGNAQAAVDSQVMAIPLEAFRGFMARNPEFTNALLTNFCKRLRANEAKLFSQRERAENRVADILVSLSATYGLEIPMKRKEIASLAGINIETCIRILSDYMKQGLVESTRGVIKIRNLDGIKSLTLALPG